MTEMQTYRRGMLSGFVLGVATGLVLGVVGHVHAQTVTTSTSSMPFASCSTNGEFWMEAGNVCHSDPLARVRSVDLSATSSSGNTVSLVLAKCPDGYSLVDAGRPMCAKDLIEPTW